MAVAVGVGSALSLSLYTCVCVCECGDAVRMEPRWIGSGICGIRWTRYDVLISAHAYTYIWKTERDWEMDNTSHTHTHTHARGNFRARTVHMCVYPHMDMERYSKSKRADFRMSLSVIEYVLLAHSELCI